MNRGRLVAVVEDDPIARRTIELVLRTGGFKAVVFESAEEFLAAPPELPALGLLLDLHLGGMSGLALLKQLRDAGSTLPVVIVTAVDDSHSRRQAERLGAVAFLTKPCENEAILRVLRSLLDE